MKSFLVSHSGMGNGMTLGTVSVSKNAIRYTPSRHAINIGLVIGPLRVTEVKQCADYLAREHAAVSCRTYSGFVVSR